VYKITACAAQLANCILLHSYSRTVPALRTQKIHTAHWTN